MRKEECFYLGKIVSRHGLKGDLLAKLDTDQPEAYENLESVLVSLGSALVPFFIRKSRLHKSSLLRISFEDLTSDEATAQLLGKELYLPLHFLPPLEGNKFYFHEIIGYSLMDENYGDVGTVIAVNDQSSQAILVAEKEGKEVLIPINDEFIQEVDRDNRSLRIRTPEGLIELYLGPAD